MSVYPEVYLCSSVHIDDEPIKVSLFTNSVVERVVRIDVGDVQTHVTLSDLLEVLKGFAQISPTALDTFHHERKVKELIDIS